jgi:hypothetical protein
MLMVAPVALMVGACGAKTTTLGVRVVDDAGQPVKCARVRAVPIGTSDVPLPVSRQTLGEAFAKTQRGGSTNAAGEVTLTVLAERVHHVQVVPPPPLDARSTPGAEGATVFFWVFIPDQRAVIDWADPPNPPGLRLELVDADRRGG